MDQQFAQPSLSIVDYNSQHLAQTPIELTACIPAPVIQWNILNFFFYITFIFVLKNWFQVGNSQHEMPLENVYKFRTNSMPNE